MASNATAAVFAAKVRFAEPAREETREERKKREREQAALLKPVQVQKVPFGVDPKTVLCAYFKAGHCERGSKCKFSHDKDVGRKVEKRNLYEDKRDETGVFDC